MVTGNGTDMVAPSPQKLTAGWLACCARNAKQVDSYSFMHFPMASGSASCLRRPKRSFRSESAVLHNRIQVWSQRQYSV